MTPVDIAVIVVAVAVVCAVAGVYFEHRAYVRRFTAYDPGRHRMRRMSARPLPGDVPRDWTPDDAARWTRRR